MVHSRNIVILIALIVSHFQLSCLTEELLQMWTSNAGSVILFTWIGFLQAESLSFLDAKSPVMLSEQNLQIVLDCDRTRRGRVFDRTMFCCEVCLTEKPGSACMRFLECDHVFCRACLRDFFELHIREGSINLMKCPEEKCGTQVHPTQVDEVVNNFVLGFCLKLKVAQLLL